MKNPIFFICFLMLSVLSLRAQFNPEKAQVQGNFQIDMQTYTADEKIGISAEDINGEKTAMNAYGKIIYRYGDFSAGLRYEAYLPPIEGYDQAYEGHGIANKYIKYNGQNVEITVGNFYDQFGNGLIFRSYEEWSLGYDNSMNGIRVKGKPFDGITLKGIYGTQRHYWQEYENGNRGIVRGVDANINLNYLLDGLRSSKTRISLGGSFVSKYEKDNPFSEYKLPENVGAYAGRLNLRHGKWSFKGEYARKINDPHAINNFIFKDGEALWLSGTYTQKGFGAIASFKRIDNFSFTSMRNPEVGDAPNINYLPPLSYQHNYTLPAMYPYATQANGEIGYSAEVFYRIPEDTKLGGEYGTKLSMNYSRIHGLDKEPLAGDTVINVPGTEGYKADFLKFGDVKYFEDLSFKLNKKVSKSVKFTAGYTHIDYNVAVIEENIQQVEHFYKTDIGFIDLTYNINREEALRTEMQYLSTRQDSGNWAMALVEYSIAPSWFFTVQDQYNFNNPASNNTYHYYTFSAAYVHQSTRFSLSYGRQREGILCVGGVCRQVPASSGFRLTISSTF
ncbi:MAG: DUF6029 family protein [Bacteroidales bacterium]|nr:DUF6029 family protein [Bacteroidales bacterium]MCF8332589.1 DUF6029 family protein [Bacteroidales bacterium]